MTSLLLLKSMLFANALQKSKKKKKRKLKKTVAVKDQNLGLCRVCNAEKGDIPIFNNFVHPNIPDEIEHFSGVTVSTTDNLSTHMCQSCLDLLNGCIMFREMCQQSNKKMLELSIKKEYTETNYEDHHRPPDDTPLNDDTDESYNIPSPSFSDDNSELWGCSSCRKEFFSLSSLNIHLPQCGKNDTEEATKPAEEGNKKKFLCDICGKTAYSNANLLVHMGIHENVFPYKCEECPYQGRTMDLLKVHKRSHLVDKPYKCTHCPKATTTSSNLAKHMRHVHSTSRPYKCAYCEKAFSYQHDMKRHVKDIHLRQGTVDCDVCYKKFNTKKILQGHRWKIHKIKGERQGRLPSYLLCQMDDNNEDNINDSEPNY